VTAEGAYGQVNYLRVGLEAHEACCVPLQSQKMSAVVNCESRIDSRAGLQVCLHFVYQHSQAVGAHLKKGDHFVGGSV
jgi:hypothetical protein